MQIRVKLAIIAVLIVVLTMPLFLITSKIYERDSYRNLAREDIARSWTGEQKVLGPILVVPYTRVVAKREFDDKLKQYVQRQIRIDEELFVLPEMLDAGFRLSTEVRYRGIYEVPVYSGTAKLSGSFSTAQVTELRQRPDTKSVGQPYLSLVIDDVRGITRTPDLMIGVPDDRLMGDLPHENNSGRNAGAAARAMPQKQRPVPLPLPSKRCLFQPLLPQFELVSVSL